jgi:hypothetical protein
MLDLWGDQNRNKNKNLIKNENSPPYVSIGAKSLNEKKNTTTKTTTNFFDTEDSNDDNDTKNIVHTDDNIHDIDYIINKLKRESQTFKSEMLFNNIINTTNKNSTVDEFDNFEDFLHNNNNNNNNNNNDDDNRNEINEYEYGHNTNVTNVNTYNSDNSNNNYNNNNNNNDVDTDVDNDDELKLALKLSLLEQKKMKKKMKKHVTIVLTKMIVQLTETSLTAITTKIMKIITKIK